MTENIQTELIDKYEVVNNLREDPSCMDGSLAFKREEMIELMKGSFLFEVTEFDRLNDDEFLDIVQLVYCEGIFD